MLYTMIDCIDRLAWEGGKNWRGEHGMYILTWDMRQQQQLCHAPPQIGEMPRDHAYYH